MSSPASTSILPSASRSSGAASEILTLAGGAGSRTVTSATEDSMQAVSTADGIFAGFVSWNSLTTSGPQAVIQIGILLWPEHRGRGIGSRAQQLLADYLFSTTTANRIEASTEVDNIAEQRALERAGFAREGLLRGRGFVRGQWRDGYMYARLRDDRQPAVVAVREAPT